MALSPPFRFRHLILIEAASWQGSSHLLLLLLQKGEAQGQRRFAKWGNICRIRVLFELLSGFLVPRVFHFVSWGRHLNVCGVAFADCEYPVFLQAN